MLGKLEEAAICATENESQKWASYSVTLQLLLTSLYRLKRPKKSGRDKVLPRAPCHFYCEKAVSISEAILIRHCDVPAEHIGLQYGASFYTFMDQTISRLHFTSFHFLFPSFR
jgi:hypothetical protein